MGWLYSQALRPRDHWSQEAEKRNVDLTLKDSRLLHPRWESWSWK